MTNTSDQKSSIARVALFPGQGSQFVGMGKELVENFAIARETFEEASEAISLDLKKLCFEGPEADLTLTQNTQPCLLTASVAAFRVAQKELDFTCSLAAGHSLGEYSALVANRCIELATAVSWVRKRGLAMQEAVPAGTGTMAAVMNLADEDVILLCEKATKIAQESGEKESVETLVEPANFNSPGQVVIAGSQKAVQCALDTIKADPAFAKAKAVPLSVSAPFHCKLMAPARKKMTSVFSETPNATNAPQFPYIANCTAEFVSDHSSTIKLLSQQIDHPVLWKQSMENLIQNTVVTQLYEFGPGKVLSGLFKRISKQFNPENKTFTSVTAGDLKGIKDIEALLN